MSNVINFYNKNRVNGKLYCFYCGNKCYIRNYKVKSGETNRATIDHVIPTSRLKKFNKIDLYHNNKVISCNTCNSLKSDLPLNQFLYKLALIRLENI